VRSSRHDSGPRSAAVGVAAGFDAGAEAYDATGTEFFTHLAGRLVDLAGIRPGATVLDVGCGKGAATVPAAIGLRESLAATRNSRAVRPTAVRARISAAARIGVPIVASQNHGRSAMLLRLTMPDAIRAPPVTPRGILTSRASTSRARIARRATVPFARVRNSSPPAMIVHAMAVPAHGRKAAATGRSIRAASADRRIGLPTGRAARTRMRAGFSPSVRRSADAAITAIASRISTSVRGLRNRSRRRPANGLPRRSRAQG